MADIHNQKSATESEEQKLKSDPSSGKNYAEFGFVMFSCALVTGIFVVLLNKIIALPFSIIFFVYIVVFFTSITIVLRRSLHNYLISENRMVTNAFYKNFDTKNGLLKKDDLQEESLLRKLLEPFTTASQSLDAINTYALISKFYAEEKFQFFEFKLLCEKWDYFTRILPNILIAFGLLGTFLGITYNLSGIVEILNSSQSNEMLSLERLQVPLQSMGIAFVSSLVALLCSILITFTNFVWNTSLAKNRLFSNIEDLLENVVMKDTQGETRLSKAVTELVFQQDQFLTDFHRNVSDAIKSSFEGVAKQMAEENRKANALAIQVYENFQGSATTTSKAADIFQTATKNFSDEIKNLKQIRSFIALYASQFGEATTQLHETADTLKSIQLSEHLNNLIEQTSIIAITQSHFAEATQSLNEHINSLGGHIEQSQQNNQDFQDSAKQIFSELQQSSSQWQDGAIVFLESAELLKESQFSQNLVQSSENITKAHQTFSQGLENFNESLTLLNRYTEEFQTLTEQLSNLSGEVTAQNQISSQLLEANQDKINHEITLFNEFSNQTSTLLINFEQTQSKLDGTLGQVGEQVSQSVEDNRSLQQSILTEFQERSNHLAELLGNQIEILKQSVVSSFGEQSNQIESLSNGALAQIDQHSQSIITLLNNIQYTQTQNNEELKCVNLTSATLADRLTEDTNKTLTALNALQLRMAQLSETNQAQTGAVLNNLSTQIQNYQNILRQALAQIVQTGEKSHANLENLKKLDQTLESLTIIRSEITKLSNLSPDLTDLIKILKRH